MPEEVKDSGGGEGQEQEAFNPDEWFTALAEEQQGHVKAYHEAQTTGLKSALDKEREGRKEAETEVRKLAAQAEAGSAAKQQLTDLADKLEAASRRTEAYDLLHEAGVINLKAAYTLAAADELFDRNGNVDVEALKGAHPYLFPQKQAAKGNAGAGTGNGQGRVFSMNDAIRSAAGR